MTAKTKNQQYPGCIAHAVIGMIYLQRHSLPTNVNPNIHITFYGIVANRGQLMHTWYVLRGGKAAGVGYSVCPCP